SLLPEFTAELDERNVQYEVADSVEKVISESDVIYMEPVVQADYTKGRDERGEEVGRTPEAYRVTRELLRDKGKTDSIELHLLPLDSIGADTQGAIGYALQQNLANDFERLGIVKPAVTVVTQTEVAADDPAFQAPSKPIGSFMDEKAARQRERDDGWVMR